MDEEFVDDNIVEHDEDMSEDGSDSDDSSDLSELELDEETKRMIVADINRLQDEVSFCINGSV